MIKDFILVASGGALGALMRFNISYFLISVGSDWPWGTLIVNLIGSFFAGILFALTLSKVQMNESLNFFLMTGFLGAFTTYSAFSAELLKNLLEHEYLAFLIHFCSNTLGAMGCVLLGYFLCMKVIA